ncbi:hypothetical protein L3I75_004639 [Vibrio vulnificus]|uniref:hypothetical protein n=1 Tax=Vibrio vulnificus TaxID=672 RepID=UPI0013028F40|nr:hypothetical protein [Vibrio vulnificus]EIU7615325.1 hypothetical protein [Vibrio vulnificus]EIU7865411.1 hypothetical protein [Vibrio vulnificus]EJE8581526.1 hypothetical protein [Vibrio vulnificus]
MELFNKLFSSKSKNYRATEEQIKLGVDVQNAYRLRRDQVADKEKITSVVRAFYDLHNSLVQKPSDNYFLSNLVSNGCVEGSKEECLGDIDKRVQLTLDLIQAPKDLYASQCEYFSRNLHCILRDHKFNQPVENILAPYINDISSVAEGHI